MQMMTLSSPAGSLQSDAVTYCHLILIVRKLLFHPVLIQFSRTDSIVELHSLSSSQCDLCNLFHMGQCVDKVIRVEQCREADSFSPIAYICRKARNISYLHQLHGSVSPHMQLRDRRFVAEGVPPLNNYLRL